jgi:large subunit ribosomal protein L35Ae
MKAFITSYRRSRHIQKPNQILLKVDGIDSASAAHKLLGKKVFVPIKGEKKMFGKVVDVHGNNGVVRARFSKGLPGQVLHKECEISD